MFAISLSVSALRLISSVIWSFRNHRPRSQPTPLFAQSSGQSAILSIMGGASSIRPFGSTAPRAACTGYSALRQSIIGHAPSCELLYVTSQPIIGQGRALPLCYVMQRANLTEVIRKSLERYPPPYDAHYGVVPPAPPEEIVGIRDADGAHALAMKAIQKADRIAASLPDHFALSRILVRQEAVNSSAMEGTHSTLDAVLEAEEGEQGQETDWATVQVRDYAVALEGALGSVMQRGREAFSLTLIQGLHKNVMVGDKHYQDRLGALRERVVWIGGGKNPGNSEFNPPPPARVMACMEDHVAYLRTDSMQPLQQSIILRLRDRARAFRSGAPVPRRQRPSGQAHAPPDDGRRRPCSAVPRPLHQHQ